MKKCGFCKDNMADDAVFEVCEKCGHKIWGDRMFKAIVDNMQQAKEAGDLYQGSVTGFNAPDRFSSSRRKSA